MFPRFAIAAIVIAAAAADDWPEFRGPTAQGLSTETNLPVEWSAARNVRWKSAIPGRGWSSPVVVGGRVYLTSADSTAGAVTLRALCLDAATGKIVWNNEVIRPSSAAARVIHEKNSLASPTPIVSDGRLYVHFGHLGTAALDLSGKVVWRQTELPYAPVHGNGGSPALVGELLVFSADGASDPFIVALDKLTGKVRWKTARNSPIARTFSFSTPLVIENRGSRQIISPASGFVGAYNPQDGRELWRVLYGEGYSVTPRPVFAHGLLFVATGFDRPVLLAIRPEGARGDVTGTNVVWSTQRGVPHTPSVLVVGNEIYFVSDGGIATCADARTGKVHWNQRLHGTFSASPVYADGKVYFQSEDGVGFVVKSGTNFQLLSRNDLGDRTLASVAISSGALFIRSESDLWKISVQ
jgi:outer membrane protein assembly factor BamB